MRFEEYDRRWRAQFGQALETSVQARQIMDGNGNPIPHECGFQVYFPEQMKVMQCGNPWTPNRAKPQPREK